MPSDHSVSFRAEKGHSHERYLASFLTTENSSCRCCCCMVRMCGKVYPSEIFNDRNDLFYTNNDLRTFELQTLPDSRRSRVVFSQIRETKKHVNITSEVQAEHSFLRRRVSFLVLFLQIIYCFCEYIHHALPFPLIGILHTSGRPQKYDAAMMARPAAGE